MTAAILEEIRAERERQQIEECHSRHGDIAWDQGELALVASCYCQSAVYPRLFSRSGDSFAVPHGWPATWNLRSQWKPKNPRRDLIRAAALIVAEIERLDRARGAYRCP
jgi:hypothetical protein